MLFSEFGLPDFLVENIEKLGWDKPTPIQTLVIPKALEGADILGGAPTGTGKSAAFLLPVIARLSLEKKPGVRAIILEPTRELALQVENVCQAITIYQQVLSSEVAAERLSAKIQAQLLRQLQADLLNTSKKAGSTPQLYRCMSSMKLTEC